MSASSSSGRKEFHFKLVLLGNSGVGKSSLVLRFVKNEFIEDMETTIGAAFLTKTLALEDSTVKLEVRRPASTPLPRAPRSRSTAHNTRTHTSAPPYRALGLRYGTLRGRRGTAPWRPCTTAARRPPL
jgi:hypothetical protein